MNEKAINKTMQLLDLYSTQAALIVSELNSLILYCRENGLRISSWYGRFDLTGKENSSERINRGYGYRPIEGAVDDRNFPWFLYWEIVWVTINAAFNKGEKVLDLGGSSSLFSYYLASKGFNVTTVDLNSALVDNANSVAKITGWNLRNFIMDMKELNFNEQFNHITSICVYEHIPMYERVAINSRIKELLLPNGRFSITFDYRNPARCAKISTPQDVYEQFVRPSGLSIRGNKDFLDTKESFLLHPFYHPRSSLKHKIAQVLHGSFSIWDIFRPKKENDYTFGSLFMQKCL